MNPLESIPQTIEDWQKLAVRRGVYQARPKSIQLFDRVFWLAWVEWLWLQPQENQKTYRNAICGQLILEFKAKSLKEWKVLAEERCLLKLTPGQAVSKDRWFCSQFKLWLKKYPVETQLKYKQQLFTYRNKPKHHVYGSNPRQSTLKQPPPIPPLAIGLKKEFGQIKPEQPKTLTEWQKEAERLRITHLTKTQLKKKYPTFFANLSIWLNTQNLLQETDLFYQIFKRPTHPKRTFPQTHQEWSRLLNTRKWRKTKKSKEMHRHDATMYGQLKKWSHAQKNGQALFRSFFSDNLQDWGLLFSELRLSELSPEKYTSQQKLLLKQFEKWLTDFFSPSEHLPIKTKLLSNINEIYIEQSYAQLQEESMIVFLKKRFTTPANWLRADKDLRKSTIKEFSQEILKNPASTSFHLKGIKHTLKQLHYYRHWLDLGLVVFNSAKEIHELLTVLETPLGLLNHLKAKPRLHQLLSQIHTQNPERYAIFWGLSSQEILQYLNHPLSTLDRESPSFKQNNQRNIKYLIKLLQA